MKTMTKPQVASACLALILLALHGLVRSDSGAEATRDRTRPPGEAAPPESLDERLARDRERARAWRDARAPSVVDTNSERREKAFERTARRYGTSPLETVGDGGANTLSVGAGIEGLRAFLAAGGHYSGPLPEELARERFGGGR